MAKTKALLKGEYSSTVNLKIGDEVTDEAEIHCRFKLQSLLEGGRATSSGVILQVQFPDGTNNDRVTARKMARTEAAAILRAMASQVAKG